MSTTCVKYIAKEPHIHVEIFFRGNALERVALSPSTDGFVCEAQESVPEIWQWLKAYSEGVHLPVPFLPSKTGYSQLVLERVLHIPFGETASYAEIARRTGNPRAGRAVGNACRDNPFPLFIPCHRVIYSDNTTGNYAFGPGMKQELLSFETLNAKEQTRL